MKPTIRHSIACTFTLLSMMASAEQLDHWEVNGSSMTDGDWTFNCERRSDETSSGSGVYNLRVKTCSDYPAAITTLDFAKPVVNVTEGDDRALAITAIWACFNGSEAGQHFDVLKLPTTYDLSLGDQWNNGSYNFTGCTNLVSVIPFLPTNCVSLCGNPFEGCAKLSSPLVIANPNVWAKSEPGWYAFKGTRIPSADLSASRIYYLSRGMFDSCSNLSWVKLPATVTSGVLGVPAFGGCTSLRRVDFHSVPESLAIFPYCYGLCEVHFYDCYPTNLAQSGVYNDNTITRNHELSTWIHLDDSQTEALAAWAAYTADGELNATSTWNSACTSQYAQRPLRRAVDLSPYHIGIEKLRDADEGTGAVGCFRIFRDEDDPDDMAVDVPITIGGTAVNGQTYRKLYRVMQIPSGARSVKVPIHPLPDDAITEDTTLTVTLEACEFTPIAGKTTASMTIKNGATFGGWRLANNAMTDGNWTFGVSCRWTCTRSITPNYEIWINSCTAYPAAGSTLDMSKTIYCEANPTYYYEISQLQWSDSIKNSGVAHVKLPENGYTYSLGGNLFQYCTQLESVEPFLPEESTYAGEYVFQECSSLTNALVYTPGNVRWGMFYGCSKIPSADFSQSSIASVTRMMLCNCSSVTSLTFGASMTAVPTSADAVDVFAGMTSLQRINLHSAPKGFLNFFGASSTALSEVHYYNCTPYETNSILASISSSQQVATYLHDMTPAQLEDWAALTESGTLSPTSTWSSAIAGAKAYVNRPLVVYCDPHAQIAAGKNVVVLDGQDGTFVVSRGDADPCVGDLVVNYTVDGEAQAGTDYVALPGTVTIPNGQASAIVKVSGLYTGVTSSKGLTVSLAPGKYEILEGRESAAISVICGYRSVNVAKLKDADKEQGKFGSFRISRGDGDSTVGDLVVTIELSGTAVNGTTYVGLPSTVTIPAGKTYVDVSIMPLDDENITEDSTVILMIGDGLYSKGMASATATIAYGNGTWGCWRIVDEGGQKKLTDGTWAFKCTLNDALVSTGDAYQLDVGAPTLYPEEISPLDFSKGFISTFDNRTYKIGTWNMQFGVAANLAAGFNVGALTLLEDVHAATIGANAFTYCSNMVFNLSAMPTNIMTIGNTAFRSSSVSGELASPVLTTLGYDVFRYCTGLTAVKLPAIKTIGACAFQGATGLVSVDFGPDEDCVLTSLGENAFDGCTALESFTPFLPSSLKKLDCRGVFQSCSSLTNALTFVGYNLGESRGFSGVGIFAGCSKIPSADFSQSTITALRREVFSGCSSLAWVKLPPTFAEFGEPNDPSELINRSPFSYGMKVALYFTATNMPLAIYDKAQMSCIPGVTGMVFTAALNTLTNNQFTMYRDLTTVTFAGDVPTNLGSDLFTGFNDNAITVWVPCEYLKSWEAAVGGAITHKSGTWTTGTTQQIRSYWLRQPGFAILVN